jgi:hypothetical protein
MHEECIRQSGETDSRVGIVRRDGLLAHISTGHHQPHGVSRGALKQQVVQWRIRQHDPQPLLPWSNLARNAATRSATQQDDRSRNGLHRAVLGFTDYALLLSLFDIDHHDCKGFVDSQLAAAQFKDRSGIAGIARQVESAQSLDGHDPAFGKQ